jgi:hypothetical protein
MVCSIMLAVVAGLGTMAWRAAAVEATDRWEALG